MNTQGDAPSRACHLPDYVRVGAELVDYWVPPGSPVPLTARVRVVRVGEADVVTVPVSGGEVETTWTLDVDEPWRRMSGDSWSVTHYLTARGAEDAARALAAAVEARTTTQGDAVRVQLAERVAEVEGQWADLRGRLERAVQMFDVLAVGYRASGMANEGLRVAGKVEGVKLALSCMEEADRG